MTATASIYQVNVSRGGVPKWAVAEATVDENGITTDRQADRRSHGGIQRALCLYSLEQIVELRQEGHNVEPGSTGENITTLDLDWKKVLPGVRMRLGEEVLVEVTDYAAPCWKNSTWFIDGDFNRINQKVNPGASRMYARVIEGGTIRPGDTIELIEESTADRLQRIAIPVYRWPRDFPGSGQ
jgi:MOSC domain-containing protein YiiM